MNVNIKDTITLDDNNEYVVVSKVFYDEINYYYLIDINNCENIMFLCEDDGDLVKLENKELIVKLLPLFLKNAKDILND